MKTGTIASLGVLAVIGSMAAFYLLLRDDWSRHDTRRPAVPPPRVQPAANESERPLEPAARTNHLEVVTEHIATNATAPAPVLPSAPVRRTPSNRAASPGRPSPAATPGSASTNATTATAQDPIARFALSSVGADPDAEAYWMAAINDPSLPAIERQDLIEDLNEDGLSDPRNPSAADLPLILNRIYLIEELAPSAIDQVNADAFAEAYRDLMSMATDLTR